MTDRELLEKAAKAAGVLLDFSIREDGKAFYHSYRNALATADGGWFAPLTDDGDALRLAVKLEIHVSSCVAEVWRGGREVVRVFEDSDDRFSATRRAIVRAAAEMAPKEPA
jgi:hypothetical protein